MEDYLNAKITPKGAAVLLFLNEMPSSNAWSLTQASKIIEAIQSISINELLALVDSTDEDRYIDPANVPQFGSIDALIRVPELVLYSGKLNYQQLGFALKKDLDASLYANIKFGENHGKGAALLGLVDCISGSFVPSSLSTSFLEINDYGQKINLVIKLYFRVPLVQVLLKLAKNDLINGYDYMMELQESTRKRRGQCIRAIMRSFTTLNNDELTRRINNINWQL